MYETERSAVFPAQARHLRKQRGEASKSKCPQSIGAGRRVERAPAKTF